MTSIKTKPLHSIAIASENEEFIESLRKRIGECVDIFKKEKGVDPVSMVTYDTCFVFSSDCRHCLSNCGDGECCNDNVKERNLDVRVECSEQVVAAEEDL